ncbi:glycosyltransferase [Vibrio lentus]|uniref:glycosyltransferase n=1 Tax=Vibrio lentus TaxID=136468 RepID=UPI000C83BEB2|nr:glycosyltransferase [Vibrio lentus]PMJ07726.1 hypothetical protein BCU30_08870 [Vibrio lentus]PMN68830.1 hypothetical protein BCT26_08310 [Vibrio lentus]
MSINSKELKSLELNRKYFVFLERLIQRISLPWVKQLLAKRAIRLAVWSSTGRYSSIVVESVYLDLAERLQVCCDVEYEENSTLHVLTECYGVGGHSKVVERWLSLSPVSAKQSVIFINQKVSDIPKIFFDLSAERNGEVISLSYEKSDTGKAKKLREIASGYQRTVLHTHMYDIVPLIAFGTEKFKRPVLLYNHADHLFWLGVTIADRVAETRRWGQVHSSERRGVEHSMILSIPPAQNLKNRTSVKIRDEEHSILNILTVGSPHKYIKLEENCFIHYMELLLKRHSNISFTVIGPEVDDFINLENSLTKYSNRIKFLGCIPNAQLNKEMSLADLVIDSFPMSGGTALGEAIALGVPVLALRSVTGHLDYMYDSESYCLDFKELLSKTEKIIADPIYGKSVSNSIGKLYFSSENPENWSNKLYDVLSSLPIEHKVYKRSEPINKDFDELDRFILLSNERKTLLFQLGRFFRLYYYRKRGCLRFAIRF